MTALIITAIVSVAAIIACNCILYRRLKKEIKQKEIEHQYIKKLDLTLNLVRDIEYDVHNTREQLIEKGYISCPRGWVD